MADLESTRKKMRELVLQARLVSQEEFDKIYLQHLHFIKNGGAGGKWETYYIQDLIFGAYRIPKINNATQAKLGFLNLADIELSNLSMIYADCAGVLAKDKNWDATDLEGSLFIDSILSNSTFRNANLTGADFSRSDMRHCNFQGAQLIQTDFENCDLSHADFRGAKIDKSTLFKNAILENTLFD